MDNDTEIIYYIYSHTRLDTNEVFYIGMGRKTKIRNNHPYPRAYIKSTRSDYWKRIVAKTKYRVDIVIESSDQSFIIKKEIELISFYGRRDLKTGTLVNFTSGGDGANGKTSYFTPQTREKIRKSLMGRKIPIEVINKIVETKRTNKSFGSAWRGKKQPKSMVEKRINTIKSNGGPKWSKESREKLSKLKTGVSMPENQYKWRYKPVLKYDKSNNPIEEFKCVKDAAKSVNGCTSEVSAVCKSYAGLYKKGDKNYRRKKYKGFIWKYKQDEVKLGDF